MAAYDFRCKECFHVFEVRASISEYDAGLEVACPTCGSSEVVRVISGGFVMAGAPSAGKAGSIAAGPSCGCGGGSCAH